MEKYSKLFLSFCLNKEIDQVLSMNKQPPKSETEEPRRPFTTREEPAYQVYQTHKPPSQPAVGTLIYDNNRDAEQPINEYEVSNVDEEEEEEEENTRPLTPPPPPTNTNTNTNTNITNIITNNEPVTSKTPPPLDYKQMFFDFNSIPIYPYPHDDNNDDDDDLSLKAQMEREQKEKLNNEQQLKEKQEREQRERAAELLLQQQQRIDREQQQQKQREKEQQQ